MSIPVGLTAGATALAGLGVNAPELLRKAPGKYPAEAARADLLAATERVNTMYGGKPFGDVRLNKVVPDDITLKNLIFNGDALVSYQTGAKGNTPGVNYNPNADRALLAHELGHLQYGQTPQGAKVQAMRAANPRLAAAIGLATILGPAAIAASQDGNETAVGVGSVAANILLNSPELVDEVMATKRGLQIMDNAGMPATMGQRARMAGGLLSYAARPVALAAAGITAGDALASLF